MRFSYDPDADALYIRFNEGAIDETDEVFPGIMLDVDMEGNPVGLEILNASKKLGKPPLTVELEIPGKLEQNARVDFGNLSGFPKPPKRGQSPA